MQQESKSSSRLKSSSYPGHSSPGLSLKVREKINLLAGNNGLTLLTGQTIF
jgi:hypothetical protein